MNTSSVVSDLFTICSKISRFGVVIAVFIHYAYNFSSTSDNVVFI